MKRIRPKPEYAIPVVIEQLLNKFDYPDEIGGGEAFQTGGAAGMAHVLIVSDSEPPEVQAKADFVVPATNTAAILQDIFTAIAAQTGSNGSWSIWMAGVFQLDDDVTAPPRCWIRGLGYTLQGGSA